MKKITRVIVGIGICLLTLGLVLPTINTVSADSYPTSSSNNDIGAEIAGGTVGAFCLWGAAKKKHHNPNTNPNSSQ